MFGNLGKTEWFPLGIGSWKLDSVGEEGFIFAGDSWPKVFSLLRILTRMRFKGLKYDSAGDWESEVSTLVRILKFNSAGDTFFKVLAPLGIQMMYYRRFLLE